MTTLTKSLRVVADNERPTPLDLLAAVEVGDMLAIMKAQRRIIAESLTKAAENTKPQFSNELNKLNALIADEESRRAVVAGDRSVVATTDDAKWDESAI